MSTHIIHGFWVPEKTTRFIQSGSFQLWVETSEVPRRKNKTVHGFHYQGQQLADFLENQLGFSPTDSDKKPASDIGQYPLLLPTRKGQPLPSPEFRKLAEADQEEPASDISLETWKVTACCLHHPISDISQLHFLCLYERDGVVLGNDFLFWYFFSQALRETVLKDQYIPGFIQAAGKGRTTTPTVFCQWQLVSAAYDRLIQQAIRQIPGACSQGYEPESLLRHFSEVVIDAVLTTAMHSLPASFSKKLNNSLFGLFTQGIASKKPVSVDDRLFLQWHRWQQKITRCDQSQGFDLGFQLVDAPADHPDDWGIEFLVIATKDPSYQLMLKDYWTQSATAKKQVTRLLGNDFEQQLIQRLGQAARIYPVLWQGMASDKPQSLTFDMPSASEFLQQSAWVLEDAGFKVIVPAWWTPKGRQRAKIRLSSGKSQSTSGAAPNRYNLSLDELMSFRYDLVIGEHRVSPEEWQQLVSSKASLVHFRGQWMQLDPGTMQQLMALWQQKDAGEHSLNLSGILQELATEDGLYEIDPGDGLAQMLSKLNDYSQLQPVENPLKLNGSLREYQKTGVAWLRYLDQIGLNGCLADDMGLGKTLQVICSVLTDQQQAGPEDMTTPTLLVAPTSVLCNWQKEVEKVAPHLRVSIHHGSKRLPDAANFCRHAAQQDILITSYDLVRRDNKLLTAVNWYRVVLDEAQNIKNPKAQQTRAICKLKARHRLALTGTPIENRLMDLWSIFNFLNPGYLGKQAQFRKQYELPIQRDRNPVRSNVLQKLLQPLVLRRLKTDKNIIQDLPDKVENHLYCNLSKEQASLYEAVVNDISAQLEASEGISRQGLMLSALMKLKQICNHPAQFLQDGSAFTATRSHKLQRLTDMLEEALADGDSVLIFSQFTEVGDQLQSYFKNNQIPAYYIHGGVSPGKRQAMIDEFQNPDSGPAVFILSIKAGGAGITLTKANHVFHFDRWWNPAVENQATDRAFRIGQKKNVFVHKFVTLGTVEEKIDHMIEEKKSIASLVTGSDESWIAKLDNEAFKQLIALNRQTIME